MQCGKDEEARFRGSDCQAHGLQITQLTNQDDVWILAQDGVRSAAAKLGVCAPHLTVANARGEPRPMAGARHERRL